MRCPRCGAPVRGLRVGAGLGWFADCQGPKPCYGVWGRFRWLALARWWLASAPWKRVLAWFDERWQVFFDWRGWWVEFWRLDPETTDMARIYVWILHVGPMEIRRWTVKRLRARRGKDA